MKLPVFSTRAHLDQQIRAQHIRTLWTNPNYLDPVLRHHLGMPPLPPPPPRTQPEPKAKD